MRTPALADRPRKKAGAVQGMGSRQDTARYESCVTTFMSYDRVQTTLRLLGIDGSNYRVLELLPLVYEWWTSGEMNLERKLRLVQLAQEHFGIGEVGEQILCRWLRHCPNIADFNGGLNDILLQAHAPYKDAFEVDELPGLLAYAEALARNTAEAMDVPTGPVNEEAAALADIASEFGIVNGASWGALVREMRVTS